MESQSELRDILTFLQGDEFFDIFKENRINIKALNVMKPHHLDIIIPKQLFGTRIVFEHNLINWQRGQSSFSQISSIESGNDLRYDANADGDIYYIHKKGRKPEGCLYSKYHNSISNLKKEGSFEPIIQNEIEIEESLYTEVVFPDENLMNGKIWLKNNIEPMEEIIVKWENTFTLRNNLLKSDIDLVTLLDYKQSFAPELVSYILHEK